jgi:hypothetical protein
MNVAVQNDTYSESRRYDLLWQRDAMLHGAGDFGNLPFNNNLLYLKSKNSK